ncbi:cytochrome B [Candidatus Kaiserbacteria bacterium CG10_big_fil_rev_8_21_14_0_10_43_70]|uniref:Cytochrome B n=1 Tax=Candidatus Kaiserbacteria bacterium CG10_big_fil_rev_8_21_14_0_10_43_70 TaxID=1974605 RepID=A0A2H0UIU2_9BACT|nr:MAG: cytochrome B [Candidatus Kaiserbacteria bacterium CG10_big_fil_rev_8_21_14_0_10_43_70]
MIEHITKSWEWFSVRAEGAHTKAWLLALSFTESFIFIIPPDPLLSAIILAGSSRWKYYAFITTIASVLGAVLGYLIGVFFFETVGTFIIHTYSLESNFTLVQENFDKNTFGVILFAAITPIPFKVFVLMAGFLKANFFAFILASILGRGARYALVAFATHKLGGRALTIARRHSMSVTVISFFVFVLYILYIVLT